MLYALPGRTFVWLTPEAERWLQHGQTTREFPFLYFEQEYIREGICPCRVYVETTILPVREDKGIQNFANIVELGSAQFPCDNPSYTFSIDTRKPPDQQVAIAGFCEMSISEFVKCKIESE